jgi:hypothetical protein
MQFLNIDNVVTMTEDPYESHEFRIGIYELNERRKAVLAEYLIAKNEMDALKKELDETDENIVKFKEKFGIYQNVR